MRKTAILLTFIFAFGFIFFKTADGNETARCAIPPFEKAFERADAVFSGKVLSVEKTGDVKTFEIEVETVWKGNIKRKTSVSFYETPRSQAIFETGGEYLVFVERDECVLWDRRCSRTNLLADASEDLEKLGAGTSPPEEDNP